MRINDFKVTVGSKATSKMTERRRRRRKEEEEEEDSEPTDEQTEVAKFLRFNCPTKSSNYHSEKVEYFKGSKAVDCLLDSKWASGKKGAEILFTDRESVIDYLQMLLELGMFERVSRVRKKKKSGEKDEGIKSKDGKDSPKSTKSKKESSEGTSKADGKKKKVKVKLELHENQVFLDGDEVYMWIYDPVHPKTIIYGVLVVIGAIILCLFPLWPLQMREYVWYLSVIAAIFLGALIVLALLRYVIFGAIWFVTAGRHHFWLLPNLTEECGVLESFVPLYTHSYIKDTKEGQEQDNDKDNSKDNEGDEEANQDDNSPSHSRDTNGETEPWIKVTDEDVAQAKEATEYNDNSNIKATTDTQISC